MAATLQCVFTLAARRHCLNDDADPTVTYGRGIEISDKVAAERDSSERASDGVLPSALTPNDARFVF